eukprot:782085-Prymnesium_polylepis.1
MQPDEVTRVSVVGTDQLTGRPMERSRHVPAAPRPHKTVGAIRPNEGVSRGLAAAQWPRA